MNTAHLIERIFVMRKSTQLFQIFPVIKHRNLLNNLLLWRQKIIVKGAQSTKAALKISHIDNKVFRSINGWA